MLLVWMWSSACSFTLHRHGIEVDEDTNRVELHCFYHPDARIRLPDVVLDRYDDGRVSAQYIDRSTIEDFFFRPMWGA